ncbi:MAG: hypothetical protein MZV64_51860 [Ignavibacteriales bacterium]|nr:hypothetical protein [Ignavibacteriales bacterium]
MPLTLFVPKFNKALIEFMDEFPQAKKNEQERNLSSDKIDWEKLKNHLKINFDVKEVDWIKPGETAALKSLKNFLENKFE